MKYTAQIKPIYQERGYHFAPIDVTDEDGNTVTYYGQIGGGVVEEGGAEVKDPDILRAINKARLALLGLKRIDEEGE